MSVKILKNTSRTPVTTNSFGKIFTIQGKSALTINDSQADQIATDLLRRYGFLKDITPKPQVPVKTKLVTERDKKGRKIVRAKKIIEKAIGGEV